MPWNTPQRLCCRPTPTCPSGNHEASGPEDGASTPVRPDFVERKWRNTACGWRGNGPNHANVCRMPGLADEGARKREDDAKSVLPETSRLQCIFEEYLNSRML